MSKPFKLTEAIKARKALRFAAKHSPLTVPQRMKLGKAEKAINVTFAFAR